MGAALDNASTKSSVAAAGGRSQGVAGRVRLLTGASAMALLLAAGPVYAQAVGGAGGSGGAPSTNGGAGGTGASPNGGTGGDATLTSGGGGGGAASLLTGLGGAGGAGGASQAAIPVTNGQGGVGANYLYLNENPLAVQSAGNGAGGASGAQTGSITTGSGGGGGGAGAGALFTSAFAGASVTLFGPLTATNGGNGGAGGAGSSVGGNGGAGGGGGNGTDFLISTTFNNQSTLRAGDGGAGGPGGAGATVGSRGADGAGGIGVLSLSPSGMTINNTGTILGGVGGGTTGAGGVGVQGGTLVVVNAGTISGRLGGDGVTRAAALSFTGGTNSLTTNAGGVYTGAINVANGATLNLAQTTAAGATGSAAYSTTGQFTGGGALQVTTANGFNVTVSGANAGFTGTTTVTGGSALSLGAANALGGGAITLAAGATPGTGGNLSLSGLTLSSPLNMLANSSVNLSGGAALGVVTVTGDPTFNVSGSNSTGAIHGAGDVVVLGSGAGSGTDKLTLTGASDYTGTTTVGDGTAAKGVSFIAGGANFFSAASLTTVTANSVLDLGAAAQQINNLNLTGGTIQNGNLSGAVNATGGAITANLVNPTLAGHPNTSLTTTAGTTALTGANTYTGPTSVQTGSTLQVQGAGTFSTGSVTSVAGALDIGNAVTQTITTLAVNGGLISSTGGGKLIAGVTSTGATISAQLTGASTLTAVSGLTNLTNSANDYTGATSIQAGATLLLGAAGKLSTGSATIVSGTLDLGPGAATQTVTTVLLTGGVIQNGSLTAGVTSSGGVIGSKLTGATGSLTTTDGLTVLANSGNDYQGATSVNGGTLLVGAAGKLSTASLTSVATGATLDLGGTTQTVTNVMLVGGAVQNGVLTANVNSGGGNIQVKLTGASSLTTSGGLTVLANNANDYGGATSVNGGTLLVGAGAILSKNSAVSVNTGAVLDLGTSTQFVNQTVTLQGGVIQNGSLAAPVTSFGGLIQAKLTDAGGQIGSLTVKGGTTILLALNNYSGATTINGGVLQAGANNTLSPNSATTVNTGGLLDLNGTSQVLPSLALAGGAVQNGTLTNATVLTSTGGSIQGLTATSSTLSATAGATTFAGTSALASITTTGAATSIMNNGGLTSAVGANAGKIFNQPGATWTGNIVGPNTGSVTNLAGGTWNGNVNAGANIANGSINNLGNWTGTANNDGGSLNNSGFWVGTGNNNSGSLTNSGTWKGAINNKSGATFTNSLGGIVTLLVTNAGTGSNAGNIDSLSNTGGTFSNSGVIANAADVTGGAFTNSGGVGGNVTVALGGTGGAIVNSGLIVGHVTVGAAGSLTTTNEIDGGLDNSGTVQAAGLIKGAINNNAGTFTVTGGLVSDNASIFTNSAGATLDVNAGAFTKLLTLTNSGTVTVEASLTAGTINQGGPLFSIAASGSVSATTVLNQTAGALNNAGSLSATTLNVTGGVLTNTGSLTSPNTIAITGAGDIENSGTITGSLSNANIFNNKTGGVVTGNVSNSATGSNAGLISGAFTNTAAAGLFTNTGTIAGGATVNGGTLTTSGNIYGGLTNAATVNASGTINGAINNNSPGTFTVTGALSSDGVSTFTNASGATLDVKTGGFTGLKQLANKGTVTVESNLHAGVINQNGGTFKNNGAIVVTQFNQTNGAFANNSGANPNATLDVITLNQSGGTFTNNATITAANAIAVSGGADFENNKTINGAVMNSALFNNNNGGNISGAVGNSGTFNNNSGGTVGGNVTNSGGFTNSANALILASVTNSGTFQNGGVITGSVTNSNIYVNLTNSFVNGGLTNSAGTTVTDGTIGGDVNVTGGSLFATANSVIGGNVTNAKTGTVNAQGVVVGSIASAGQFVVTGVLSGGPGKFAGDFANSGSGVVTINAAGADLRVNSFTNGSAVAGGFGLQIGALGKLTAQTTVANLNGSAMRSVGVLTATTFRNAGDARFANTLNANIDNQAGGSLLVAGALTSNGTSLLNEKLGKVDVQANFTATSMTVNSAGTFTVESGATLSVAQINQAGDTFTNYGTLSATNGFNNAGKLVTSGTINGALTNTSVVKAQGVINGLVTNSGTFVITGDLHNNNNDFINTGTLTFGAIADPTFDQIGTLTNSSGSNPGINVTANNTISANTVVNNLNATINVAGTLKAMPGGVANSGTINLSPTGVINGAVTNSIGNSAGNRAILNGQGTINGDVTNNQFGAVYVGAGGAALPGSQLTINGNYNGNGPAGGVLYTLADLGASKPAGTLANDAANAAVNATVKVATVNPNSMIDVTVRPNGNNNFFNQLTVAYDKASPNFMASDATKSALAAASNAPGSFYVYKFGQTAQGQGVIQTPNVAAATSVVSQVASTITALNTSFFQNSAAFLGQAQNPAPNHWDFGVWNRDAVSDTNIASNSTLNGDASTTQPSHVDTRLAGYQFGVDAGLFNIQNSGMAAHFGLTAGEAFASSIDHASPGISSTAQVPFVGAYGAVTGKGFAGIVGVRYDTYQLNLTNGFEGINNAPLGAHGLSFTADVQYVIPVGTNAFLEPSAGLYASRTNIDTQVLNNPGNNIGTNAFAPIDSTLSRIGLRAGMPAQAGGILLQPFAAINAYHEWATAAQTTFTPAVVVPNLPAQVISTSRVGTFEQASLGVGWQVPGSGWTGYARADAKFGSNIEGWTLTAGLRYTW